MILSICETPELLEVMRIVKTVVDIIKIVVPIILIVSLMVSIMGAVSGKIDDDLPKVLQLSINKIFAAILVFLIPTVINILFATMDAQSINYAACLNNATPEKISASYINRAQKYVIIANDTLTRGDYNAARSLVLKLKDPNEKKNLEDQLKEIEKKVKKKEKEDVDKVAENMQVGNNFIYPLGDYKAYLTACFDGNDETHRGAHGALDFGAPANTPVIASKGGSIEYVDKSVSYNSFDLSTPGCGNYVIINHQDGTKSTYCHMFPNTVTVDTGDVVSQGDKIGEVGSTGNSTGFHLHFAISENDVPVDPIQYTELNVYNPDFCS